MSNPELVSRIVDEIARLGPIPFARFMALALYHPEHGYYTSTCRQMGWKGDYYTSSHVHPIFGELVAKQLLQMDQILGGEAFSVVEMGAGKGLLCHDILRFLQKEVPETFRRLRYIIIEKSPSLQKEQADRLGPLFPDKIIWREDVPPGLMGIILSNELVDAFPVHRLKMGPGLFQEVYVDWSEGQLTEILGAPSTDALQAYVKRLGLHFEKPVYLEVNLQALDWMRQLGQTLDRGFVITIDYGYPAELLYTIRRPRGTLLCYYQHTFNEDPYCHLGEQDMTAHVDFTSLVHAGREAGLMPIGFTDQTHFLMGLGIAQRMESVAVEMDASAVARKEFLAMRHLMAPDQMGKTFKVLIQGKGIPLPVPLDGLQFRPFLKFKNQ